MATTIDETISELADIVAQCKRDDSRAGYFAAMYLTVTEQIKQAIADGTFDDGPRMEQLDVVFAGRFIDAFNADQAGGRPSAAWSTSFEGTRSWRPIIVQQLLTGMNAHINLDLGIAAATVAPGDLLPDLEHDFNKINAVLASMTEQFTTDVASVSPWIGWLDRIGGTTDQSVIRFSIDVARDSAWELARQLAPLPKSEWGSVVDARDVVSADLGHIVLHPGRMLSVGLFIIRLRETKNVSTVIDHLRR